MLKSLSRLLALLLVPCLLQEPVHAFNHASSIGVGSAIRKPLFQSQALSAAIESCTRPSLDDARERFSAFKPVRAFGRRAAALRWRMAPVIAGLILPLQSYAGVIVGAPDAAFTNNYGIVPELQWLSVLVITAVVTLAVRHRMLQQLASSSDMSPKDAKRRSQQRKDLNRFIWKFALMTLLVTFVAAFILYPKGVSMIATQFDVYTITDQATRYRMIFRPGADHWFYYQASMAIREHVNPYINGDMYKAVTHGVLGGHLNPLYNELSWNNMNTASAGSTYNAPPTNLWMLMPLTLVSFTWSLNVWILASLVTYTALTTFWVHKTSNGTPRSKVLQSMFAFAFFVGFNFNLMSSLRLGQVDIVYITLLVIAFHQLGIKARTNRSSWLGASAIALAAGFKVFPGIVLGYFAIRVFAEWRHRVLDRDSLKVLAKSAAGLGVLVLLTFAFIPGTVIQTWARNASSLAHFLWPLAMDAPSAWHYAAYWTAVLGGAGWVNVAVVSLCAAMVAAAVVAVWKSHRSQVLLGMALLLSLFPTVSPHNEFIYSAIILVLMPVVYFASRSVTSRAVRIAVPILLVLAYLQLNDFLMIGLIPGFQAFWTNGEVGRQAAMAYLNTGTLQPYASLQNLLAGWPGWVTLFSATWLTLRAQPTTKASKVEGPVKLGPTPPPHAVQTAA